MLQKLFFLISLVVLVGCQASGGGAGGDIVSGHTPVDNKFTLSTTNTANYTTGQTISFVLTFPKTVVISGGTPSISVTIGAASRTVPMTSTSGATLTFNYLVDAADVDNDGIAVSTALNKNGASIKYDTTYDTSTTISVPSLTGIRVNPTGGMAPVANNINPAAFNEEDSSTITLSYTDANGDLATACTITSPTKVTVSTPCTCVAGVCTVGVTGSLNQTGAAGFQYTVTANSQTSNTATAAFLLNNVPDAPIANNITPPAFNEDTQSIITLSYTDGDADLASSCSLSGLTNVTITQACACAAGTCTVGVTGTLNYSGAASFNYSVTANGQSSNTASATLTINNVGDAPVANNISPAAFNEDTQSIITLSYTDAESDLATVCSLSGLVNVTVSQACACAAGICTVGVTGTSNYNGSAGFNYTVTAGGQASNTATATLSITSIDDAPVANNITPPAFNTNVQTIINLSYTDVESHQATVCTVTGETGTTITQACSCTLGSCSVGVTSTAGGAASFNYTVTANGLVSNSATASLTVNGSAPVANNITPAAFNEDTQGVITLSYTDAESDLAVSCNISSPTNITVTQACACAAGVCTVGVTGTLNYNGAASFTYTVTANAEVSNSATATLTVTSVDDDPVANNITPPAFNEDTLSNITLSYSDVDSDPATTCSISATTNVNETTPCSCVAGVCTVGVTGLAGYSGPASFNFTVTANGKVSNTASATLTINNVADAPIANNITPPAFNEDTASTITLSYTDEESDLATSCSISSPTNVTVTTACACAAGVCTVGVTGTANYNGAASFSYTVTANAQVSNSATATLSITAVEDAPVASNITPPSFNEDAQSIITLSYTDVDSQATTCTISNLSNITVTQACACAAGTCTVGVTGTSSYFGPASFDYTVTSNAQTSNTASASLTILNLNDPPVANNINPAAFNEDTQSVITLSYTDPDSDQATSCSISGETNVTVTQACACAAGVCTVGVTGTLNYSGSASFNYTVTANLQLSNSASATLTINPVNDAPVASNITPAAFNEDVQSIITLSYTDAESDSASSCTISLPTNISVTQACACAAGICTVGVTGTTNYSGSASFSYTVTANAQTSNTASATLIINPVDDAPIANNITPAAFNEDTQSVITLSYTDVDGDSATACSVSGATNVTVTQACACAAGVCTVGVTGTSNYSGSASFNYTVTANSQTSNSASATLSITGVNDAPVANNITPVSFNEDTDSTITLSYTDTESDQATSCSVSGLTNVTVQTACACAAGVCTVTVRGTTDYNGSASFNYTVTAASQTSNSATASLTINPVADAPVAQNITPPAFNEDTASTITLVYTDAEGDFASSCSVSNTSNVTITTACTCTLGTCTVGVTPTANYNGVASFDYTVTANSQVSNIAIASLTVTGVDDAPVASNMTPASFNEDTQSIITLSYTDVDSQATTCALSGLTNVTQTQACACAAGVCTVGVTGSANYNGAASFTFTVTSNSQTSNAAVANFTINSVNDLPVISAIANQSVVMNTSTGAIAFTITDVDNTLNCGTSVTMSSTNTTIVPNSAVAWAGTAPNCTGTITPATGQSGTLNITFNVSDGVGGTSGSTFQLEVGSVNLVWVNEFDVTITTYSFGTPGANTTKTLFVKNTGTVTSGTVTVTNGAGNTRITQTNSCTTIASGATCAVTFAWDNGGGPGLRTRDFSAAANGSTANITVSGTK